NFRSVHNAVCGADVDISSPSDAAVTAQTCDWGNRTVPECADCDPGMTFLPTGLISHIGIINFAVSIDRDRRIGALCLRSSIGNREFCPGGARIRTERTALEPTALIDWKPDRAVRCDVEMST